MGSIDDVVYYTGTVGNMVLSQTWSGVFIFDLDIIYIYNSVALSV